MASSIEDQARDFACSYSLLFSSPDASSLEHVGSLSKTIGKHYRPGMTMFTNGNISRFGTQEDAATLIETEMRNNITSGLGTKLILDKIEKIEGYSDTSALCWLTWTFQPQVGSKLEGKKWTFTNIYGYRASTEGCKAGWELVVRDSEVNEFKRITGQTFEG